jgi:hypothetical protein
MESDKFPKLVCKHKRERCIDGYEFGIDVSLSCEEQKREKEEGGKDKPP